MNTNDEIMNKMIVAVECAHALDMPYKQGLSILQSYGFDNANRFEFPATLFVKQKQEEALEAIAKYTGV